MSSFCNKLLCVSEFVTSGVVPDTVSAVGGVKKLKISSEQYEKYEKPCLCPPRKKKYANSKLLKVFKSSSI